MSHRHAGIARTMALLTVARRVAVLAIPALLAATPGSARSQTDFRAWRDWQSLETRHVTVHFPAEAEPWARPVAERMDAIRDVVGRMVGHAPDARVQIIVDDPFGTANGFAVPVLDRPVAVFWTTPPTPRQTIGHFRGWGELLAVHEYAHLAHLTIPARNPRDRLLMALSPWPGSPVALRAPRWVIEGYATYVEGRVTAHGRPHNAWRAAVLRQWALEGRLPTYGQLNGTQGYQQGAFAYLAGSAFLEHTARRDTLSGSPDSSLAFLWRRLSARTKRDFDQAFAGLHGRAPGDAYGRFVTELSDKALQIERAIEDSGGVVQGELVQRLAWETGDLAIAPDGGFVAVVLRSRDAPARVVLWRSGLDSTSRDSPDKSSERRRRRAAARDSVNRARDPLDVPDRRFVPPPKQAHRTLRSRGGAPYESPRFLGDSARILLTRLTPVGDGSLRHDLYVWDVAADDVRRVTHGAGVRDADPSPDGSGALGIRCRYGSCDVVRVDLATGDVRTLLEGSPEMTFHRPRWFSHGAGFTVAMHRNGRWRVMISARDGSGLRPLDPDDGASRFDPVPLPAGDSVVVVSDRGGIMNLEMLPVLGGFGEEEHTFPAGEPRTITRVTGAALAPEPHPGDGSIWYLSLHSRGLDVRRLQRDSVPSAPLVRLDSTFAPLIPTAATRPPMELPRAELPPSRPYGFGPRDLRWLPSGNGGPDGYNGRIVLSSADLLGRLHVVGTGAFGEPATERGGSLAFASRVWRAETWGEGVVMQQRPSASRAAGWARAPIANQLDLELHGAGLGLELAGDWQTHALRGRGGVQAAKLRHVGDAARRRMIGALLLDGSLRQRGNGWSLTQRLMLQADAGAAGADRFTRRMGTLGVFSGGRSSLPFSAVATWGALSGTQAPFERFIVGGVGASLTDPLFLAQRLAEPALPFGATAGTRLLSFRGAAPLGKLSLVYAGASTNDGGRFAQWQRTTSVELAFASPPIPMVSVPAVSLVAGVGRALDQPGRPVRGYFTVSMRP